MDSYVYDDADWGDLLTSYNGIDITYDAIGNPLNYYNGSNYTFTWSGRRLTSATKDGVTYSYTYNDEGIRTSKTVGDVTTYYLYSGSLLISEYTDTETIIYIYDANGSPLGFKYRLSTYAEDVWDTYWYEKSIYGDIVAIYSENGTKLISYLYDAWGNASISYTGGGASTTAVNNRLTYRGYYYDADTGLYYLQSRYYDAKIGRFISPDSLISGVNGSLHGFNLYAYCFNNPVAYMDSEGNWPTLCEAWEWFCDNIVDPVIEVVDDIITDFENYDKYNTDEGVVIDANYFSSYNGHLVIRTNLQIAFSMNVIVLSKNSEISTEILVTTLKHEYGHTVQLDKMGFWSYLGDVALPSFAAWLVAKSGNLPFDYHTSPWEAQADYYGGVDRGEPSPRAWNESDGKYEYILKIFKGG